MSIELGLKLTEPEYRELDYPSYSLLSGIAKQHATAVNGIKADISDHDAIVIGQITDARVTDGGDPDNLVVIDKKPAGKPLNIIKALCDRNDLVDEDNPVGIKNKDIIDELCKEEKYYDSKSPEDKVKVLKKYNKYVKALRKYGNGAIIASNYQYQQAVDLSNEIFLRYSFVKGPNILGQVKLLGEVNGETLKIMLDFIFIDHKRKIIMPFDLKTGFAKHYEFFEKGYLGWNYYLQASLYREILKQNIVGHPDLHDYKVDNFRFLYCGRQDKLPLIYKVTDRQHEAGFTGFNYHGMEFQGINELIEDFKWYKARPNAVYKKGYDSPEVVFDDSYLR